MNLVDRTRIEKAGADCGFELTPVPLAEGVVLRSAVFPEAVTVQVLEDDRFALSATSPFLLEMGPGEATCVVQGFGSLYASLQAASARARTLPNRVADSYRVRVIGMPTTTEAERLVVQRVGQDLFRNALLDYWQGRCCVTGLAIPELLRASHIKPWAKCVSDDERLDIFNGLLLAPHLDALFDDGWISFTDAGEVIISSTLPTEACGLIGLTHELRVAGLKPRHMAFLAYHRHGVLRGISS